MKKVIIVGAGISGLAAGFYAARAGFDVTILEQHIIPGGLSTAWSRKGYLFEGGMHWLTGSSEKLALNKVWREVGALKENNPIFMRDPFYTLRTKDGRELNIFRDIDKTCAKFLEFAPEDKKAIKKLQRDVHLFMGVHAPVINIAGCKMKNPIREPISGYLEMAPALLRLKALAKQSYLNYIGPFKNADIRHLLSAEIGLRYNALSFIYTLASFASGDCGYPIGGSLVLSRNMAESFEAVGGKIKYKSNVSKIVVENKKVTGVICNNEFVPCDAVINTQDLRQSIDTILSDAPLDKKLCTSLRKNVINEQNMFVCLGVKADLKNYPKGFVLPLEKPFMAGGLEFRELRLNNYAEYENHSPKGCTVLTCLLLGNSYNYWKKAKLDGTYKQKKQELAELFIQIVQEHIPEIKENVEVTDVATPLTYERYCSSFEGSWMSVWTPGGKSINYPLKAKGIEGLYFAGQRTNMPGGLPIAVLTGRQAAQYLCRDNIVEF